MATRKITSRWYEKRSFPSGRERWICITIVSCLTWTIVGAFISSTFAAGVPTYEYRWNNSGELAYTFEIEAETDGSIYTVKGSSNYQFQESASREESGTGMGTAFVIHRNGYLLTCEHVVHGGKEFIVKLGKNEMPATVLETDAEHDLALLQVAGRNLTALPLADFQKVQLAQSIRVVGYPLSDILGNNVKIATGSIAGKVDRSGRQLFQLDAAVNPGNSGGPVVNDRGEVVGIANSKLAGLDVSNVGFAVPAEEARRLLNRRHIINQAPSALKPLQGPDLANRVTPAVAMVTVRTGAGGIGKGKNYRLSFQGICETWKRPKNAPLTEAILLSRKDNLKGRILADTLGEVRQVSGVPHLPFGLGPQGLVGIERLPNMNQQTWQVQRTVALSEIAANSPVAFAGLMPERSFGGGPPRPRAPFGPFASRESDAPTISLVQENNYELGRPAADGTETFNRRYRLSLPLSSGRNVKFTVSGDGVVQFDRQAGSVRSSNFSGTLSFEGEKDSFVIPIKYTYSKVELRAIAKPESLPPSEAKAALPNNQEVKPTFEAHHEPPPERKPLPAKADRDHAEASVTDVFGDQIEAARSSSEKLALAEKLINAAASEPNAPQHFALLNRARLLATDAGDLEVAREAAEELIRSFRIDCHKARIAVVLAVAKKATGDQNGPLAQFSAALLEELITADEFDAAGEVQVVALSAAHKAGDVDLVKQLDRRSKDLKRFRVAFQTIEDARTNLAKNAADPTANTVVGKYYCLSKGEWEKGLPMLIRGNNADLKAAAEKDLAAPTESSDQLLLADQWWKLAEHLEGDTRDAMRARALKWYGEAAPQLVGLEGARVEKRLDQFRHLTKEVESLRPATSNSGKSAARRVPVMQPKPEKTAEAGRISTETTTKIVGNKFDPEFKDLAPEGGLLVGFDVGLGKWAANDIIVAIRPIYRLRNGKEVQGKLHGTDMSRSVRVRAKTGYAVGAITVRNMAAVDGFSLTFMRANARALDLKASYESEWIGGKGGRENILGGDGSLVVGIVVHENNKNCSGLGLCLKR